MTRSPNVATDMLIDAAIEAEMLYEWADQTLCDHGVGDQHRDPLDALADAMENLRRAFREFTHYSDGRVIRTCIDIDPDRTGYTFGYTFPAIVEHRGERLLCEAARPTDPDEPDRGQYRIYVDDAACTIRVELTDPGRRQLRVVR